MSVDQTTWKKIIDELGAQLKTVTHFMIVSLEGDHHEGDVVERVLDAIDGKPAQVQMQEGDTLRITWRRAANSSVFYATTRYSDEYVGILARASVKTAVYQVSKEPRDIRVILMRAVSVQRMECNKE